MEGTPGNGRIRIGKKSTIKKRFRRTIELSEHLLVAKHAKTMNYPLQHVPNEGKRFHALDISKAIWIGFPDFIDWFPRPPYMEFLIELKKDRKDCKRPEDHPSLEQWIMIDWFNTHDRLATVAYGAAEAISFLDKYHSLEVGSSQWTDFLATLHVVPEDKAVLKLPSKYGKKTIDRTTIFR